MPLKSTARSLQCSSMKKLVVVADDFGLCDSVNRGVMTACTQGIVTEVSLMIGSPATDAAIALARAARLEHVGIHLLLKHWRDTGSIFRRADYLKLFAELSEAQIAQLAMRELKAFERLVGRKPSHITSQFGIAGHEKVLRAVVAYARLDAIPLRLPVDVLHQDEPVMNQKARAYFSQNGVATTDHFFAHILGADYGAVKAAYMQDLRTVADGESVEIALHPGFAGAELRAISSLVEERQRDVRLSQDRGFQRFLDDHSFTLSPYRIVNF